MMALTLGLVVTMLAGCDAEDDTSDDDLVAAGAEVDGDGSGGDLDDDAAQDDGGSDDGANPAAPAADGDGNGDVLREACAEYGMAQACASGGTRFCDEFDEVLAWGDCLGTIECRLGDTTECDLDTLSASSCMLYGGAPTWVEIECEAPIPPAPAPAGLD
jgi:hypothetical protein